MDSLLQGFLGIGMALAMLVIVALFFKPIKDLDANEGWRQLWVCLAVSLALCIQAVNANIALGTVLVTILMAIGFSHPLSALFVMGASQIVPEPAGWPVTLAQLCILVFALSLMLQSLAWRRGWTKDQPSIAAPRGLLAYFVPLVLWLAVSASIHGDYGVLYEVIKGGLFAIIGWNLIRRIDSQRDQILAAISIGGIVALSGYWGDIAGIPTTGIMHGGEARGFEVRIGAGRGDSNNVGPALSLAMAGLVGAALVPHCFTLDWKARRRLVYVLALLLALGLPATMATMSRGSIGQFIVVILLSFAALLMAGLRRQVVIRSLAIALSVILSAGLVLWFSGLWNNEVLSRATSMWEFQVWDAQQVGASSWDPFSGRRVVWTASWSMITDSPLIGMSSADGWERYGPAASNDGHNVLLDAGRSGGFPGMFLLAILIFSPLVNTVRTHRVLYTLPTLLAYSSILLTMSNLGIVGDKRFWLLWVFIIHQLHHNQQTNAEGSVSGV